MSTCMLPLGGSVTSVRLPPDVDPSLSLLSRVEAGKALSGSNPAAPAVHLTGLRQLRADWLKSVEGFDSVPV